MAPALPLFPHYLVTILKKVKIKKEEEERKAKLAKEEAERKAKLEKEKKQKEELEKELNKYWKAVKVYISNSLVRLINFLSF